MARNRHSDWDILKILREIAVHFHCGIDVVSGCLKAGVSDRIYYAWRKKCVGAAVHSSTRQSSFRKKIIS